ncbi:hypothetical protein BVRB_1g019570 [Beta vulgaris subsp. vulgaris]|nr:hypothetical protein BVRB_1g019570 [Beta vulgaris subsp. vulgaris]
MSMEYYTISLLYLIISLIPILLTILFTSKVTTKSNLPPGPKPWPIIGSIHKLGDKPHHVVAKLSKIYGPIMSLKLGSITTIVISSPEIAKEMFLEHDLALSSRPMQTKSLKKFSMVWLPVCPKWRHLRKIATLQLFTTQRLDISQVLRHTKVKELMEYAQQCCENNLPVDIGKAAFTTSLNLLSNTIFSMDLASHVSSNSQEFKDIVWNIMESRPNVLDYIPLVRKLDLQGVLKRKRSYFKKIMGVFEEIIDVRLKDPTDVKDDVLGTLLKLVKDEELSLHDVKHMLFVSNARKLLKVKFCKLLPIKGSL